jgi:Glycosyl transferase family 2
MSASNLSCVICAYNEAPRIADVLSVATAHHLLQEVIVVDDGSTDDTADIVRSFPSVRLISCPENRGKSRALAEGVRAVTKEYIMLLDADLKYLTMANITELAEPIVSGAYEMSISVRKNSFAAYRWIGLDFVSGERIIPKRIVAECLSEIDRLPRFGIEVYMNERIINEGLNIAIVRFENVTHTRKTEKMGWWSGTVMDWKTTFDVLKVISPFEVILQNYHMLALARHIRTLPRRVQPKRKRPRKPGRSENSTGQILTQRRWSA